MIFVLMFQMFLSAIAVLCLLDEINTKLGRIAKVLEGDKNSQPQP